MPPRERAAVRGDETCPPRPPRPAAAARPPSPPPSDPRPPSPPRRCTAAIAELTGMPCLGEDAAWSSNGWTADDVADGTVTDAPLGSWPLQRKNFFDWKGGLGDVAHAIGDQLPTCARAPPSSFPRDACEAAYVEEYRSSVITQQYNKWALERPPPPNPPPPMTPPMGGDWQARSRRRRRR